MSNSTNVVILLQLEIWIWYLGAYINPNICVQVHCFCLCGGCIGCFKGFYINPKKEIKLGYNNECA